MNSGAAIQSCQLGTTPSQASCTLITLPACTAPSTFPQIKGLTLPPDHPNRSSATADPGSPAAPTAGPGSPATVSSRPAFPHLVELDLSCSASAVGGGIELQLELLQAAMPLLRVLKLSGLGGYHGELNYILYTITILLWYKNLLNNIHHLLRKIQNGPAGQQIGYEVAKCCYFPAAW